MNAILFEVDAWVTALVLAAVMLAAWSAGWWQGRRLARQRCEVPASKLNEASLALLGLLLAFTFSMSLGKHDQRRQMVVTDSNAIGDFYTCASLLKGPVRGKLQGAIREYTEHRIALVKEGPNEDRLKKIQDMQDGMQELVGQALGEGTQLAVPLVNTLNEVTSSHAARLAAARDRLPWSIVALLFLTAILSMVLMGKEHGSGKRHLGATTGFIVLVCMTVWVTLDLNQPQRGAITVSQEPMQRLLAGMSQQEVEK